jgi:hypothetical protein
MNPPPAAYSARSRLLVIAIFIALGAYVLFGFSFGEGAGQPTLQQREEGVLSGSFVVPGNKSVVSFIVPANSFDASLQGNYSATAASQPSLPAQAEMYVMDAAELSDYQDGADCGGIGSLYSSGGLTSASFDVQLPSAGAYYLVFALQGTASCSGPVPPGLASGSDIEVDVQTNADLIYTTCSGSEC